MTIKSTLLSGPLGFGTAPLGNMFRNIPEEEAAATVAAAWEAGTRYFDTAPFYGAGLAEIRLGRELMKHKRDEYVLSTKVGRISLDEVVTGPQEFGGRARSSGTAARTRSSTTILRTAQNARSRTA
jgi:D-threo-aldose 1-dehydrogenase